LEQKFDQTCEASLAGPDSAEAARRKGELQKNEYQTFKLRQNPGDADSPTYELTVPLFQTGTPEEYLTFIRDVRHVIEKQNITTGPGRYSLIRTLLRGDALAAFNAAATGEGNETC
jgi:hypothetical protein